MITGVVTARREILMPIPVHDRAGQEQGVEAVLDTGFNGSLSLPPRTITGRGLPWHSRSRAVLANGAWEEFDAYAATVVWDGRPRRIQALAIDGRPLLGMRLLSGFELRARIVAGGRVEVEAIP